MSEPIPERADVRQLRTQAKELLRSLQSGETLVDGKRLADAKLSDAQLLVARKFGFDSWPKLVSQIETPVLIEKFKKAIDDGDAETLEQLLKAKPVLRKHIDDPMFFFGSQAILRASSHSNAEKLIPILVRYGADPNVRSKWWAGGFGALDHAKGKTVDLLLRLGAKFDVWSAAAHGRIDVLRELLDKDPSSVNAPGGDGERPLHFAATAETAELLIGRGADLKQRDVDHEGTPIQHQVNNPEVLRVLLQHGAKPDIFSLRLFSTMVNLARRILNDDPDAINARAGHAPFVTKESDGGLIYICIQLWSEQDSDSSCGGTRQPGAVLTELLKLVSPARRLVASAWLEDEEAVSQDSCCRASQSWEPRWATTLERSPMRHRRAKRRRFRLLCATCGRRSHGPGIWRMPSERSSRRVLDGLDGRG